MHDAAVDLLNWRPTRKSEGLKKEGRSNPDPSEVAESLTPVHIVPKVESGNWHRFLWLRRAPFDDPKADIDYGLRNDLAAAPVQ